jgi:hypothetical protein
MVQTAATQILLEQSTRAEAVALVLKLLTETAWLAAPAS